MLSTLPASDKYFSRLLGEVPVLPESALKLLDDLCYSNVHDLNGKEVRDGERVTQGLGAVWSLILGRPNNRQACLAIALKVICLWKSRIANLMIINLFIFVVLNYFAYFFPFN